jgi:hypothetical protein
VESEALVERDVALRTGLENHGRTALARQRKPELDERRTDTTSLPAGCDCDGVEMPERLARPERAYKSRMRDARNARAPALID